MNAVVTRMTVNEYVRRIKEAFSTLVESAETVGRIYVEAIDADPRNADKIKEACRDFIPTKAWNTFERIGRGEINPAIAALPENKSRRLLTNLPRSLQDRVIKRERFPLLLENGDTLEVDYFEASPDQAEQLFGDGELRTLSAQRAWMEQKRFEAAKRVAADAEFMPIRTAPGKLIIKRSPMPDLVLTKAQVKNLLMEM